MIETIDNFLNDRDYEQIAQIVMGNNFPWYFNPSVADDTDTFFPYFTHTFYDNRIPKSNFFNGLLDPLLNKLNIDLIIRIKANLFQKTEELYKYKSHVDYKFKHYSAVYSINTCDGGTIVEDEFIKSVANRLVIFHGNIPHQSTTCTDASARVNIQMNWVQPSESI